MKKQIQIQNKPETKKVQLNPNTNPSKVKVFFQNLVNFSLLKQTIMENLKIWIIISAAAVLFIILFSFFIPNAITDQITEINKGPFFLFDDKSITSVGELLARDEYKDFDIAQIYNPLYYYTTMPTAPGEITSIAELKNHIRYFDVYISLASDADVRKILYGSFEGFFGADLIIELNSWFQNSSALDNARSILSLNGLTGASNNVDVTVITMFTSMIGTFLALIYTILVANSLIASKIDRGSMAYILSTPIRRSTVTNTQTAFMLCSVVSMYTLVCVANIIIFAATGVSFNAGKLIIAYFGFILFTVMISSIAFAASCYFNLSKLSLAVGGGIPILFYVLTIMMQISTDLEFFKYLTINSFFSKDVINNIYGISVSSGSSPLGRGGADAIPKKGMEKNMWILFYGIMAIISAGFYTLGGIVFKKKDLPL